MQFLIVIVIGVFLWYSNIATDEQKIKSEQIVKEVAGVSEIDVHSELINIYNTIHTVNIKEIIQNESTRFEAYNFITKSNKKLKKYISYNGNNNFAKKAKQFITIQDEYLTIVSNNIDDFRVAIKSTSSNNISDLFSGAVLAYGKADYIKNKINKLKDLRDDSETLIYSIKLIMKEKGYKF